MPSNNVVVRALPPANLRIPIMRADIGEAQALGITDNLGIVSGEFFPKGYNAQFGNQGLRVRTPHVGMRQPGVVRAINRWANRAAKIPDLDTKNVTGHGGGPQLGGSLFKGGLRFDAGRLFGFQGGPTIKPAYPVIQMPSGPRFNRADFGEGTFGTDIGSASLAPPVTAGAAARLVIHAPGFRLFAWQTNPHYPRYKAAIRSTKERMKDISPVFRAFQPIWFENETMIFDAEGIPSWPQLSPNYAQRKEINWPGKTILRRTDRLYNSLTSQTSDTVYEYGPRNLKMGTLVEYSRYANGMRPHVYMLPETWERLNAGAFNFAAEPFARPTAQLSVNAWADNHMFDISFGGGGTGLPKYGPGVQRVGTQRTFG